MRWSIIDSPDFTHRVARRVRKAAPDIPIINYAPPSVWVWRPWRARAMRRYVDEVLAILPFEPDAFARLNGPHCTYVGHPLAERLSELRPNAEEARRRLADPPLVLVLPGSRRSEIHRLAATFGRGAWAGRRSVRSAGAGAADAAAYCGTGRRGDRELDRASARRHSRRTRNTRHFAPRVRRSPPPARSRWSSRWRRSRWSRPIGSANGRRCCCAG